MPGWHWLPDVLQRRLLEREGHRDLARLGRRLPEVAAELGIGTGHGSEGGGDGRRPGVADRGPRDELREAHGRYLSLGPTDPAMAASLPFADVLGALCRALRPRSVAELGTGFSSWVVRRWSPAGAEVVSVDDDPQWLERSRAFVRAEGLREGEFVPWETFRGRERRHDLVVWDFGGVRTRASATPEAADRVAAGGALLFDDVHKHRLWKRARRLARRRPVEGCSLHALTLDEYGRYAWLALFGDAGGRP